MTVENVSMKNEKSEVFTVQLDPAKPLGFRLDQTSATDIALNIAQVRRKSQAFKSGIKSGDLIVAIEGFKGKMNYSDVMDFFQGRHKSKTPLTVSIQRGRENGETEPSMCIKDKPVASHSATSSSPTPASATNVCCLHGVQSKPGYAKEATSTAAAPPKTDEAKLHRASAALTDTKKEAEAASLGSSVVEGLFNFFKRETSSGSSKSEKPPAPAPPPPVASHRVATSEAKSSTSSDQQSWIQRAFQFTEGFSKGKSEEQSKSSTSGKLDDSTIIVNSVQSQPAQYIIKTTPVPPPGGLSSTSSSSRLLHEELKHKVEPRYPSSFGSGSEESSTYAARSSSYTRTSNQQQQQYSSPTPAEVVPEVTIGQTTVQIHVKPSFKHDYQSSESTYTRSSGISPRREPTPEQRFTPSLFSPKAQTTTTSEDASTVQRRRRQWPPPSNATGVDVAKDNWIAGPGNVADLEAPEAHESRYQSYSVTTNVSGDYGGNYGVRSPSTVPVDTDVDTLAATVNAAALRKSKFGEQISEQVRMCQNIARALNSPVESPSKAQRMFNKRKDRMEKWVHASIPSSIQEEEKSSYHSESYQPYQSSLFEPISNTQQTFEVIRQQPPQNWYVDTFDNSNAIDTTGHVETVPVESYKKYSRMTYKSTSSYHSAADNESDLHLPKQVRNPQGEVHDYQTLSKEYGDNIAIASPEKSYELSSALTSESQTGKGAEMFHRRRQRAEDWVVDDTKTRVASRSLPPTAPRRHINIDPAEVIESVHEAAARKEEELFSPSSKPRSVYTPLPPSDIASGRHTSLTDMMDGVGSPNPQPAWGHERLFSPTPYSFSTTPRPYTPMDFGGRRTPMHESHYPDYQRPEVTTSVLSVSTPSTRIVTNVHPTHTTTTSGGGQGYNTLPRSWKSFSSAYKQNYVS